MATFVVLAGFTDQGIRNVKETISRAEAFKEMARKSGITVKELYWTLGQYDVIGSRPVFPGCKVRRTTASSSPASVFEAAAQHVENADQRRVYHQLH